ncbi:MAG: hypothetical protein CMN30_22880 [Sandaracinus sp.]|nr:hypothetical protein [Sandaracinus sp.]
MVFVPTKNALLAGRYEFERPVGEGGMGAVWRARDLRLHCPVAVKVLWHDGRDSEALSQRFLREARVAASVQHVNVVRTTDFGIEDDTPYMVMELVEGESLADRMGKRPPLSINECVEIASSVLRGLAAAHDVGVIHRDIKPENVHLVADRDGVFPKILDFGIASALKPEGRVSVQTTQAGGLVGTPHYMSPEQARGLPDLDARSDVYAVGAMLYEMLTGATPVDAELPGDLLLAVVKEAHVPAIERRPELGKRLSHALDIALRKDRDERYPTASAFRKALHDAIPKTPKSRPDVTGPIQIRDRMISEPPGPTDRPTLDADELLSGAYLPPPAPPRSRTALLVGAAVVLAAALVAVGIFLGASEGEVASPTADAPQTREAEAPEAPEPPAPTATVAVPTAALPPTEVPAEGPPVEEAEEAPEAPVRRRAARMRAATTEMAATPAEMAPVSEMSASMGTPTAFRDLDY